MLSEFYPQSSCNISYSPVELSVMKLLFNGTVVEFSMPLKYFLLHRTLNVCSYNGVKNYHLLSHIFRTESVKYNENYTRAAKRPEVIIRII